jgi:hypothetical protein
VSSGRCNADGVRTQTLWSDDLKGSVHLTDVGSDDMLVLNCILRREDVNSIQLAQNKVQWRAFGNVVMNHRDLYNHCTSAS